MNIRIEFHSPRFSSQSIRIHCLDKYLKWNDFKNIKFRLKLYFKRFSCFMQILATDEVRTHTYSAIINRDNKKYGSNIAVCIQ